MSFFTGFITSRRWAFEEMFRGLKRNAGANAFAVLLSALALTIPLWIALVFYGLSEPLRSLPTSVELTVFTKEGADAVKVANAVRAAPLVTSAQVIGKDEALKALNAQLGLPSQTAGGNPLPDIIVAVLDDPPQNVFPPCRVSISRLMKHPGMKNCGPSLRLHGWVLPVSVPS